MVGRRCGRARRGNTSAANIIVDLDIILLLLPPDSRLTPSLPIKMALATKTESQKIFEKLKQKPANKVGHVMSWPIPRGLTLFRSASIAVQRTRHGLLYLSPSISALTAQPTTGILVSTSPLSAQRTSTVGHPPTLTDRESRANMCC